MKYKIEMTGTFSEIGLYGVCNELIDTLPFLKDIEDNGYELSECDEDYLNLCMNSVWCDWGCGGANDEGTDYFLGRVSGTDSNCRLLIKDENNNIVETDFDSINSTTIDTMTIDPEDTEIKLPKGVLDYVNREIKYNTRLDDFDDKLALISIDKNGKAQIVIETEDFDLSKLIVITTSNYVCLDKATECQEYTGELIIGVVYDDKYYNIDVLGGGDSEFIADIVI